jgi:preprotein translocase subunit SecD
MLKGDNFRLVIISLIFSASVLTVIPKIGVRVSNKLLKIDSSIGGYSPKIFGKVVDLTNFKQGVDAGGMGRLTFTIGDEGSTSIEKNSQLVKEITEKRLDSGGQKEAEVYISKIDGKYNLVVEVPKYVDKNYLAALVYGTGNLTFKTLKDISEWKPEAFATLAKSPESWLPTDISRNDVSNLLVSKGSTGQDQLQIIFTPEGKLKFNKLAKENVDKPIAFYINDQEYPVLIPVVDASLAGDVPVDPALSGYFPQGFILSFQTQFNNGPLPVKLSLPEVSEAAPKFGDNFLEKLGLAILAGFGATTILSLVRFRREGILFSLSVFSSTVLLVALIKIFSITVDMALVIGFLAVISLFAEKGYEILHKIYLEKSSDKPYGYLLEKIFVEQSDVIKYVSVALFFTMLFVS